MFCLLKAYSRLTETTANINYVIKNDYIESKPGNMIDYVQIKRLA